MLESQVRAREIRERLLRPVNGHRSSELEIVPQHAFRKRLLTDVENRQSEGAEMPVIPEEERRKLYTQAFSECLQIMREALGDAGLVIAKDVLKREEMRDATGLLVKGVRVVDVIRAVSVFYGIPLADLLSSRRTAPIVRARQIAMYVARTVTLRSTAEIGRQIGDKDHSTVIHAVDRVTYWLESDEVLESEIEQIKRALLDR